MTVFTVEFINCVVINALTSIATVIEFEFVESVSTSPMPHVPLPYN